MNYDILLQIFKYCEVSEISNFVCVNKRLLHVFKNQRLPKILGNIDLIFQFWNTNAIMKNIIILEKVKIKKYHTLSMIDYNPIHNLIFEKIDKQDIKYVEFLVYNLNIYPHSMLITQNFNKILKITNQKILSIIIPKTFHILNLNNKIFYLIKIHELDMTLWLSVIPHPDNYHIYLNQSTIS